MASEAQPNGRGNGGRYYGRGAGRGQGRGAGRGHDRGHNPRHTTNAFKGSTLGMNRNVFQVFGESTDKQQFTKTLEALEVYINKTVDYPKDMSSLCKSFKITEVAEPKDLTEAEKKSETKKLIWKTKVQTYVRRTEIQEKNCQSIFSVIWGQCSVAMRNKLESLPQYEERSEENDCAWLLIEIKGITLNFEGTRYVFLSIDDAKTAYYGYVQPKHQPLSEYLKHFQSLIEVMEHYKASVGEDGAFLENAGILLEADKPNLGKFSSQEDFNTALHTYNVALALVARNRSIALAFLKRADKYRYGQLWTDLENQYTRAPINTPVI